MPGPLDAIAWHLLADTAAPGDGTPADRLAHHVASLAARDSITQRRRFEDHLVDAGADPGYLGTIYDWLVDATAAHRSHSPFTDAETAAAVEDALQRFAQAPPAGSGRLLLDARLGGLPLLDLARDVAARLPTRSLRIRLAPAGPHASGRALLGTDEILLDPSLTGDALPIVWAHELGHVVDHVVGGPPVTKAAAERIADDLAAFMLRHRPERLDDLAPIARGMRHRHATHRPRPWGRLPDPSRDAYAALFRSAASGAA